MAYIGTVTEEHYSVRYAHLGDTVEFDGRMRINTSSQWSYSDLAGITCKFTFKTYSADGDKITLDPITATNFSVQYISGTHGGYVYAFSGSIRLPKTVKNKRLLWANNEYHQHWNLPGEFTVELAEMFRDRTQSAFVGFIPVAFSYQIALPSLSDLSAERWSTTAEEPSDESQTVRIAVKGDYPDYIASDTANSVKLHYAQKGTAVTEDSPSVDLTSHTSEILSADGLTLVLTDTTFDNGYGYDFLLVIKDSAYRAEFSGADITRAFANVHLSAARNGGVCFGGFSKSTDDNPMFECYYPVYFYGGGNVGGATLIHDDVQTGNKSIANSSDVAVWTVTIPQDGLYHVDSFVSWASRNGSLRALWGRLYGADGSTAVRYVGYARQDVNQTGAIGQMISGTFPAKAGQILKIFAWQNTGSALNVSNRNATVVRIGEYAETN